MELFEHVRRDRREDGVSIRELARRHRVHRRMVRRALLAAPTLKTARSETMLGRPHNLPGNARSYG